MSENAKVIQPWERQPGEPDEAWLAFRAYRDSPPHARRVSRTIAVQALTLGKWFREWNWRQRVDAYDAVTDEIVLEERRALQRQTARELALDHMTMIADFRDFVGTEMAKWVTLAKENEGTAPNVKPQDLAKIADVAVKLDRLVRGETTESIGTPNLDLSKLNPEDLEAMLVLLDKAKKD